MAIGKDTALRLILIDDQANEDEAIVSSLRNAGIAVRPQRLEDLEALAQKLAQQPVDLVLAEHASAVRARELVDLIESASVPAQAAA